MVARKKIALIYSTDYNRATGIVIYVQNIIKHFMAMEDSLKPYLVILYTSNSPINELKEINYPLADYILIDKTPTLAVRALNKIARLLFGKPVIRPTIKADFAYPALNIDILRNVKQRIYWKEDFQECYYPQYFSQDAFKFVNEFFSLIKSNPVNKVVLSSFSAGKDLQQFYPEVKNPVYYLRFVSLLPPIDDGQLRTIMEKFDISLPYFIVSNQFWPHKNHILVLKAALLLREMGFLNFKIVFTGKTTSFRDPDYFPSLQQFIKGHGLTEQIVITGFLPRSEQLLLMKHGAAVVQPSLFEGWSTVVEDAKALNKYILAVDLPVTVEQVRKNVSFFGKDDAQKLSNLMKDVLMGRVKIERFDYETDVMKFRNSLAKLFELSPNSSQN